MSSTAPRKAIPSRVADALWGEHASPVRLVLALVALLFLMLGSGELRSIEGRWAAICTEMMRRGDYLHPYLFREPYYDKPLLSYWLMIGCARVLGSLSPWALRLPSALAGLVAVLATVDLGRRRFGAKVGLLAGWVLATSYFFVDWSRTASADMMNVAGTMVAIAWYVARRDRPGFTTWAVFLGVLAVTSLTKGLIGAALPMLVILPDLLAERRWRRHITLGAVLAALPAAALYLAPFLASSLADGAQYGESGLGMVFRENVLRYFEPFDHKGSIFTYLVYLPLYLLPWGVLLLAAVPSHVRRFRTLDGDARWLVIACALAFTLLTASGSRRSYYVLPILPLYALLIARWLATGTERLVRAAGAFALFGGAVVLVWFGIFHPIDDRVGGLIGFGAEVRSAASTLRPWRHWRVVLVDAAPKSVYYLYPEHLVRQVHPDRAAQELPEVVYARPATIVVTRRRSLEAIKALLPEHRIVVEPPDLSMRWFAPRDDEQCVAFIPYAIPDEPTKGRKP